MLTKEQILKATTTFKTKTVEVPEWGGKVTLRELNANERDRYDFIYGSKPDFAGLRAALVTMSMVDESGSRMQFTDAEVDAMGSKSGAVMDRLFDVAMDLSGLRKTAIEAAAKNSSSDQSDDSG